MKLLQKYEPVIARFATLEAINIQNLDLIQGVPKKIQIILNVNKIFTYYYSSIDDNNVLLIFLFTFYLFI